MKYDILGDFRAYLDRHYSKNTANKYYHSITKLFKDIQFNNVSEINFNELDIKNFKGNKNEFSALKNALFNFKKFNNDFQLPEEKFFSDIVKHKRNRTKSKGKVIDYESVCKKINGMRDKKYKYAFRLAMVSGLRVSELAGLRKKDLTLNSDGTIDIFIERGKGGKSGRITSISDPYLTKNLNSYLYSFESEENVFPARKTLINKASTLDLEMHDFRRIFAIRKRKELMEGGLKAYEANGKVMEALRHIRFSTTKRYLYNRKLKIKGVKF